jgi:predicted DNA-binding transcriptional regulator YafY
MPEIDNQNIEIDWDNSPEGIAAWLDWYSSLEPLIFTDDERAILAQARKEFREWELAHAEERAEKLRRLWDDSPPHH